MPIQHILVSNELDTQRYQMNLFNYSTHMYRTTIQQVRKKDIIDEKLTCTIVCNSYTNKYAEQIINYNV